MIVGNRTLTDEQTQIRRHFIDFFEDDRFEARYNRRMHDMMQENRVRLIIDMEDLLDFTPTGAEGNEPLGLGVMRAPILYLPLCEIAVHDLVVRRQPNYLKIDYRSRPVHVGFEGPIGKVLSPRELYAQHLNSMISIEGIITRQSPLRPRVIETVHYCTATNKFNRREYRDQLSPMIDSAHLPTVNVMPRADMQGNPLRTELGLSSFVDSQCAVLQEAPEVAPTGQLPRSVELRFDDDLVDTMKPGDRVAIVGVYCPYTMNDNKNFETIILVNNTLHTQMLSKVPRLLEQDSAKLRLLRDVYTRNGPAELFDLLARSVAPGIYGLNAEKKAVLLMLLGGVERQANTTHIRGDINVLLVGEPSTAKSQLLRFVLSLAPLAISTTGKGSSGVGLTAAVTVDSYTGERSLSAGAMVLADRGIICIDEFDKMNSVDRVAMHEAMEQQTVTIAKAGIHASLNARCSVLAAANPVYGFYSTKHKLAYNIGLPESLLSRFDLTFVILDQHSSDHNRRIGTHILRNHLTANPVALDADLTRTVIDREAFVNSAGAGGSEALNQTPAASTPAGGDGSGGPGDPNLKAALSTNHNGDFILSVEWLRRFLQLARGFAPVLTESSQRLVSQHYVQLRAEQNESKDGLFITARTLESIVRLATAHAKLRLSNVVEEVDVDAAMALLRSSVHAAGEAATSRQRDRADAVAVAAESPANPARKAQRVEQPQPAGAAAAPELNDTQVQVVFDTLNSFRRENAEQSVLLHEIRDRIISRHHGPTIAETFSLPALKAVLSSAHREDFTFLSTETEDAVMFT